MSRLRELTRYTARLRPVLYELREENQLLCADNKSLRAENERLREKALKYDLDQAGIEQRDLEAVELVEVRAENERLRELEAEKDRLLYARESVEMVNQILERENERLRELVKEATEEIEAWGGYASDYFQQKHDLEGTLRRFRTALEGRE